ncbi:hypothetical protein M3Y97_01102900 [Aphelenchoides bicaudatus]|nr:hypothetical protein M3Y97_01102900 [Aphelenchoides bicaudatus]
MDFCGGGATKKVCKACDQVIEKSPDSVTCEGFIMHIKCFTCAICNAQLKHGSCARDHGLDHVKVAGRSNKAPLFFCTDHMMLGSGEKMELLKKKAGGKK